MPGEPKTALEKAMKAPINKKEVDSFEDKLRKKGL